MVSLTAKLGDEYLKQIGQVTVNFAIVGKMLELMTWALISEPDEELGATVTSELSFKQTLALASSLYRLRHRDTKKVAEFEDVLAGLARAEERRNLIVHSVWGQMKRQSQRIERIKYTARRGKGLQVHHEFVSPEDIEADAKLINDAGVRLGFFMSKLTRGAWYGMKS